MEREAQAAAKLLATMNGKKALDQAIRTAELYMRAASNARNSDDAQHFRRKCKELIAQAETIKAQLDKSNLEPPSTLNILRASSLLHGNNFPPWNVEPSESEFQLQPGAKQYTDDTDFVLSRTQAENFLAWSRPQDLFGDAITRDSETLMSIAPNCDLVQDVTTDCSVVASLSAALEILTGKHSVLSSMFYPFDQHERRPRVSSSGKYIMRMNFNGCSRRVTIDDRLPASKTERMLFVVDRMNPQLLWPALLEKAYLKVRGGYDFPGSNSGTDLWVLTGWIPEQLFLQREDFDLNQTWDRIKTSFNKQDVVVTLGTGRISAEEEELMGLVGEHDYAVLDLDASGDTRKLLIKNPWCNGPFWTGAGWETSRRPPTLGVEQANLAQAGVSSSGTLWVALEDVAQHFESMYLNWNPSLFPHRQDLHFSWETPPPYFSASLIRNKQFSLLCSSDAWVWILISRHFVDGELHIMRNKKNSFAAQQLGYMSILIFANDGNRVQISGDEVYRGPYVDSPQTLARLEARAGALYTIVLDQQELPLRNYTFTMSLFSSAALEMREAVEQMCCVTEEVGNWTRRTAGGNSSCPTYFLNPQYSLTLSQSAPVSIVISTDNRDVHVHVDLVWGSGRRATSVRVQDLVATSGEYRQGCYIVNIASLESGAYTIVCSTFESGQVATFLLRVSSMVPVRLQPIAADAAGRLRNTLPALELPEKEGKYRTSITASWLTRSYVCIRSIPSRTSVEYNGCSSMIRFYVVYGWGSHQVNVAEAGNGEFQEPTIAIRTPDFDIDPDRVREEGMWLVVETMRMRHAGGVIECDVFSDSPVHTTAWESC